MIEYIKKNIKDVVSIQTLPDNEYLFSSDALFDDGKPYEVCLKQRPNETWYFSDRKCLLKHMEPLYELTEKDVKMCIKRVLEVYGFKMSSGELICDIEDKTLIMYKYFQFISCISTLINMYAFFDEPEDKK